MLNLSNIKSPETYARKAGLTTCDVTGKEISLPGNVVSHAPLLNGIRGISSHKIDWTRDNQLFMLLKMYFVFAVTVYLQNVRKERTQPSTILSCLV